MLMQIRLWSYLQTFLILGLLTSCEEQTDWVFQPLENGALVVEAIITDEFKTQEVLLSRSYDHLNGKPVPVSDAEVRVIGGGKLYIFQSDINQPGRYVSTQTFSAQLGIPYTLEIEWNGTTYLAENEMTAVSPFNRLAFKAADGTDSLSIDEVPPLYLPHEQAMYQLDIDWSNLVNSNTARAKMFFYTFNTIDINEIFRPPKETILFPKGSMVIEKKYSLNPAFAAYLRALLMETEWQGGVFDEASGSLPTNISNGGLGFFAVCAVLSDTWVAK